MFRIIQKGPLSIKAIPIAKLAIGMAFILRGPF